MLLYIHYYYNDALAYVRSPGGKFIYSFIHNFHVSFYISATLAFVPPSHMFHFNDCHVSFYISATLVMMACFWSPQSHIPFQRLSCLLLYICYSCNDGMRLSPPVAYSIST